MIFDSLTLFGVFAVTAMLVFYELEDRSPWFILVRRSVRPWFGLWVPARRVAIRSDRSGLDLHSCSPLADQDNRVSK